MIDFGYQSLTSQEFLLWIQSNERRPDRGFAAGSNYNCYGRFLASLCRYSFWPRAIVFYFFDPVLSDTEQHWMRAAISRMATGTGMALVEVSTDDGENSSLSYQHARGTSPYLKISKKALSNLGQATVGRVSSSVLNMSSAYVTNENTFNHEMGHVFGLLHEHQREDRNTHITVPDTKTGTDYDIVRHDNRYWFFWHSWTQPNATTYSTPYDYHSVMHYRADGVTGFVLRSSGERWTVRACNKAVWGADNGATYFTPWDIYTIKKLYGFSSNTRPSYTPRPITLSDFTRDADGVYPVIDPSGRSTRYSLSALLRALRLGSNVRPAAPRQGAGDC